MTNVIFYNLFNESKKGQFKNLVRTLNLKLYDYGWSQNFR